MATKKDELTRTIIHDNIVYFGERELTNLIWTLIRIHRYKNQNRNPETIVFPDIREVGGVKIEFAKEKHKEEQNG